MKIGISTATFFQKELTEDCFSVIKNCKGECCEVFLTTFSEYESPFPELFRQRADENDISVYSVHALNTTFEPQLFNLATRTRDDAEKTFINVCKAGKTLGAKVYTFHGSTRVKKTSKIDPVYFGKRMKELGDIALSYGITLCLENVHWAAGNSPEFFKEMLPYCENIGTVLDIKQAQQSFRGIDEYLDVMGDRLKNVHISDMDENGNVVMVGKGQFDFTNLILDLKKRGYDGPLMVEQYCKNYEKYEEVEASVKYMKQILEDIKC